MEKIFLNKFYNQLVTKKGDQGWTFFQQRRVKKDCILIEVIGQLDEIQAWLNSIFICLKGNNKKMIKEIQGHLYNFMAFLAFGEYKNNFSSASAQKILEEYLKTLINKLAKPIDSFKQDFSNKSAVQVNLVRTIVRRCERKAVQLKRSKCRREILPYLNRLSDFLFILACVEDQKGKNN